jgi:regulator of RNase E activity RraA
VIVDHSTRFNQELPRLLDVPGFTGIRIHPGNSAADTDGCILVGLRRAADSVLDSRKAFEPLLEKIRRGIEAGQCCIEVAEERDTSVTA